MFKREVDRVKYLKARIREMEYAYRETLNRYKHTSSKDIRYIMWSDLKYYNKRLKDYIKELESYETENNDGPTSA
jgi:hypothetical protein